MVDKLNDNNENIKFCPLLTVVKAGQANYMVCQNNCVFFIDDECAFITTSKALKELMKNNIANQNRRDKNER